MEVDSYARPVLSVDFDLVMRAAAGVVPAGGSISGDPAVRGTLGWLHEVAQVFDVVVFTASASTDAGRAAVVDWLTAHGFVDRAYTVSEKPGRPTVDIAEHNATTGKVAARAWEELEPRLARLIEPVLARAGRKAAAKFKTLTTRSLTADAYRTADRRRLAAMAPSAARALIRSLALTAAGVPGMSPNSTMVAVMPTPEQANALAIGDQDADVLHVTLAYLGEVTGDLHQVAEALGPVAASFAPLQGKVAGGGQFGDSVRLLLPDVPGLVELRVAVTDALVDADIEYGREHGYQPHITVGYLPGVIPPDEHYRLSTLGGPEACSTCSYFEARGWCQMFGAKAMGDMVCDDWTDVPPPPVPTGAPLDFMELLIVRGNDEYVRLPLVGVPALTAASTGSRGLQSAETQASVAALLADETILEALVERAIRASQTATSAAALTSARDEMERAKAHVIAAQHLGDPERVFAAQLELRHAQDRVRSLLSAEEPVLPPGTAPPGTTTTPAQPTVGPPGHPQPAGPPKKLPEAKLPQAPEVSHEIQKENALEMFQPAENSATATDSVKLAGQNLEQLLEQEAFLAQPAETAIETVEATPPEWTRPAADEVLNTEDLMQQVRGVTDPVRQAVIQSVATPVLDNIGLGWDEANPFAARVLAQSASQITAITETTQADVMDVINLAYQQGLTIDDTAKLIQSKMTEASPARARLIARTELAGAVNGGSLAATQIVSSATGTPYTKTWRTAPGAPHPRHENYPDLDGQHADLDGYFTVGDAQLKFPGDPDGPPGEVCNCRCTLTYEEAEQGVGAATQSPEDQALTEAAAPAEAAVGQPKVENAPLHVRELPPNVQQELELARQHPEFTDVAVAADMAVAQNASTLDALQAAYAARVPHKEMFAYDLWQNPSAGTQLQEALRADDVAARLRLTKDDFRGGDESYRKTLKRFDDAGYKVNEHEHSFTLPVRDVVTNLDQVVDQAPLLTQPLTVYRGLPHSGLLFGKGGPTVGETYVEKGYTQATLDEKVAAGYSRGGAGALDDVGAGPPAVVELGLSTGQKAAWGRTLNDQNHDVGLTLPRNTRYVVDGASKDSEGVWHVQAHAPDPIEEAAPFFFPGGEPLPAAPHVPGEAPELELLDVFASPPGTPAPAAEPGPIPGPGAPVREQADAAQPFFFPPAVTNDTVLGITPFRREDNPVGFFESAKAKQFEADLKPVADQYGVQITGSDHVTGVWQGLTEPSYSVHAHDGVDGVARFAETMRAKYDQDGVLIFRPDPAGHDFEFTIHATNPDAVVAKLGDHGIDGATVAQNDVVLIGDEKTGEAAVKLADEFGGTTTYRQGVLSFAERPALPDFLPVTSTDPYIGGLQKELTSVSRKIHRLELKGVKSDLSLEDEQMLHGLNGYRDNLKRYIQTPDPRKELTDLGTLMAIDRRRAAFDPYAEAQLKLLTRREAAVREQIAAQAEVTAGLKAQTGETRAPKYAKAQSTAAVLDPRDTPTAWLAALKNTPDDQPVLMKSGQEHMDVNTYDVGPSIVWKHDGIVVRRELPSVDNAPTGDVAKVAAETQAITDHLLEGIPPPVAGALRNINIFEGANPDDKVWAEQYHMPGFLSGAASADGQTTFWNAARTDLPQPALSQQTLDHEIGHLAGFNGGPKDSYDWVEAANKDARENNARFKLGPDEVGLGTQNSDFHGFIVGARGVSDYGSQALEEDWAESMRLYLMNMRKGNIGRFQGKLVTFEGMFPNRAAEFEKQLGIPALGTKAKGEAA